MGKYEEALVEYQQALEVLPFLLAADPVVEYTHQDDEGWQTDAGVGAGMDLVVQRSAQNVIGREQGKVFGVGVHPFDFAAQRQQGNRKLS